VDLYLGARGGSRGLGWHIAEHPSGMLSSVNLRLLHLADLHLGAKCAFMGERASERTKDFERAFERAMQFAREPSNGIALIVVAGDLFDSHRPESRLVELVRNEFTEARGAGIRVVVVPGTHDAVSYRNSVYRTEGLGDVLVITNESPSPVSLDIGGLPVHIYGAVRDLDCTEVPLDRMSRTEAGGIHIGIVHAAIQPTSGPDFADAELSATLSVLSATNLDYIALGHYHNFSQQREDGVTIVYPGTLEGRTFRETGERYLVTVTFTKEGPIVQRTPFNARTVRTETLDLDTAPVEDFDALCSTIEAMADEDAIVELTIQGDAEFSVDAGSIEDMLLERFFYLKVVDKTRLYSARWVEQFRNERTVRGVFVRKMLDRIEKASTDDEKAVLDMALKYGLSELVGEDAH
jgi:DNA repair exonuclease SbcCD nuclease subunit